MSLSATDMADEIKAALESEDSGMFSGLTSNQLIGFCTGIVDEITDNGSATYGTTSSGHPISGMSGSSMASGIVAAVTNFDSTTTKLIDFCTAIVDHIESDGDVTYLSPTGLGVPSENYVLEGTISGLSGSTLATLVKTTVGYPSVTSYLTAFCTAIVDHIESNAEVEEGVIS